MEVIALSSAQFRLPIPRKKEGVSLLKCYISPRDKETFIRGETCPKRLFSMETFVQGDFYQ